MSHQWDDFSKSLAEEPFPRRESLRRLGAAFAGALFGSLGLKSAVGAPKNDPCTAFCKCSNQRQKKACVSACRDCNSDPHFLCGSCAGGYVCTDLVNDPGNCGTCSNYCDESGPYEYAACVDGRCEYDCVSGAVRCNGTCTYLESDPDHCGACGNACPASAPYCNQGTCVAGPECEEFLTRCGDSCVDLAWDPDNCGECGNVCGDSTPVCDWGTCWDCESYGLTTCGGQCIDTRSDNSNCGACGFVCGGSAPYCSNGACISGDEPCPGGGTRCNGVCTNINFDSFNCGGCGIRCTEFETCSGGGCQSPF